MMVVSSSRSTSPATSVPDPPHDEPDLEYSVVPPPASKAARTTVSSPVASKPASAVSVFDGAAVTAAVAALVSSSALPSSSLKVTLTLMVLPTSPSASV